MLIQRTSDSNLINDIKNIDNNNENINNINLISNSVRGTNEFVINKDFPLPSSQSELIYIGKYVDGLKNGKGKLILPNIFEYEGNFQKDKFNGYGIYKCKKYNYYGNFIDGKKNGKGKYEDLEQNRIYEGYFLNDKKHGYGEEEYSDGSYYKGDFKNDLKNGKGIFMLDKKDEEKKINFYNGDFKNDKIWGEGLFIWNKNKEYFGEWVNDEISGYGVLTDGDVKHFGFFNHNMKDGFGASFYLDKNYALLGKWEEDLIDGPSILLLLNDFDNNNNHLIEQGTVIGMFKGEIIKMGLGKEDINIFKNSENYQELCELFKNKFFPDFLKSLKK